MKPNIPTEDNGEVRSNNEYVVAAGSYVTTTEEDIDNCNAMKEIKEHAKKDKTLGNYVVINQKSPIKINYEGLPAIFKENKIETKTASITEKKQTIYSNEKKSALFSLKITDILDINVDYRTHHPLHESTSGMNFSISESTDEQGNKVYLGQCWRHLVSLNALQYLAVKSGYMSCLDAGTGHKNTKKADKSSVTGDNGAIFHAWLQAKKDNLIPKDDRIPVKAMRYIAKKHGLIDQDDECEFLPDWIYNDVLKIVETEY